MEELEKARKKALKKKIIGYSITFSAMLLCLLSGFLFLIMIVLIFGILLTHFISAKNVKSFKDLYKQNIVIRTFNSIFTDVQFDLDKGISYNTIANTKMMHMGDRFYSNDYVKAKYKNINFEMSDVHIEEEYTDSDGNTSYVTIFKGQWYIFDFNKSFKANLQVCEKSFMNAKRGGLFSKEKFQKVELEDIEFNKIFKVYAVNELDAFYVLTPHTMEKIKEVNKKIKGHILLCFIDNKLHIGLHNNRDLFEASIYKKINLDEAIEKTKQEMSIITNFVDILNLDNDLFKFEGGVL